MKTLSAGRAALRAAGSLFSDRVISGGNKTTYDNCSGSSEDPDLSDMTALGDRSIVIHK